MIPDFVQDLLNISKAVPTFVPPASAAPGSGRPINPAVVAHAPATTEPTWAPNVGIPATATLPAFTAAGVAEAASNARGQQLIDAVKDVGRVDTTPLHYGPWPLAASGKK